MAARYGSWNQIGRYIPLFCICPHNGKFWVLNCARIKYIQAWKWSANQFCDSCSSYYSPFSLNFLFFKVLQKSLKIGQAKGYQYPIFLATCSTLKAYRNPTLTRHLLPEPITTYLQLRDDWWICRSHSSRWHLHKPLTSIPMGMFELMNVSHDFTVFSF